MDRVSCSHTSYNTRRPHQRYGCRQTVIGGAPTALTGYGTSVSIFSFCPSVVAHVSLFCFCLEAVNKSWKTLENEEGYRRCQEIIEEAKSRTDTLVSSIRVDSSNIKYCSILECLLLFCAQTMFDRWRPSLC